MRPRDTIAARAPWRAPAWRRTALLTLCATAAFAFAAHGFLFSNEFFSHDSISYFTYATGTTSFYISIGRFLIPAYELCKGAVAAPWLIGLLFILWMTLTALVVTDLLAIRSRLGVVLTCGLLCTNLSLTLTGATYVYCMDEYALALFAAALAAWLWTDGRWWSILAGLGALVASLALYQAYFTGAAVLCLLVILRRLADDRPLKTTVLEGIRYLLLLAAGFVAYYGLWTALCALTGTEKRRVEESLLSGGGLRKLFSLLRDANVEYIRGLFDGSGVLGWFLPVLHALLLAALAWYLVTLWRDRGLAVGNKVLITLLACLLPTALNSVSILLAGTVTQLMTYAGELLYLLALQCRETADRRRWNKTVRAAVAVLLCCVLWQHIVYANQVYMKKELDKNATLVLSARLVDRIEQVEGYVPGETPVAFVGRLDQNTYLNRGRDEFQTLDHTVGLWSDYSATYNLGRYLTDYLNVPLLWDTETDFSQWEEVQAMSAFPAADSIALVDGTVVVKLS